MAGIVPAVGGAPEISVLLATHGRPDTLVRALESLAEQTLAPERFEVEVVINGPSGDTPEIVDRFARAHPGLNLRVLESSRPGVAHARTLGLWAARGAYMTILDDDDWVSPRYLEVLLEAVEPGVVPLAWLAEVHDGADEPSFDNYFSNAVSARAAGDLVPPYQLVAAISLNVAKLVPVSLARRVGYDESLVGGSDFVFWTNAYATTPFRFRIPERREAVYYRTRGHGSLSRQDLGFDFNVRQRLDCIASLERITGTRRDAERVVRSVVAAQCGLINRFVRAHPDQHGRVVEAVEAVAPRRLDWSRVNAGVARDLALLYSFTPWNSTSGIVAARRVRERGVVVDVIAQDLGNARDRDEGAWRIAAPYIEEQVNLGGDASFSRWPQIRAYCRGVSRTLARWEAEGKGTYRSVYSRAMWVASHIAAAQYKIRHPETRWLAEFSDPLNRTVLGEPRPDTMRDDEITAELRAALLDAGVTPPVELNVFAWAEHLAYALADEITFTNEHQRQYMMSYCPDPALVERVGRVSRVAPHPTLPPQFYAMEPDDHALDPERVHIGYFGVFYVTRGLTELTDALAALPGPVRSRVKLHIFTSSPDELAASVREAGLADVVEVNPYLPFLQYLNATTRFDVLVVNDARAADEHGGVNPYLPSKLSDYLGSGRPIWAISEPGSVLSRVDVAYRSSLGDVASAVEVLTRIVDDASERLQAEPSLTVPTR